MPIRPKLSNFKIAGALEYKGKPIKSDIVFAEDKLDGLRLIVIVRDGTAKAYTRNGTDVPNAQYIVDAIEDLGDEFSGVFDGEAYCDDWNKTSSIVMTQSEHPDATELKYRVFDFLRIKEWDAKLCISTLENRKYKLESLVRHIKSKRVLYLPHVKLKADQKSIETFMNARALAGLEGGVFKLPDSYYSFKKSKDWLKLKPYKESDCKIVGMKPGKKGKTGQMLGLIGSLEVEGVVDGKRVKFNSSGMTMELRKQMTEMHKKKKLIGKIVEVRHEGLTVNNKVRFPRFQRIRLDK